MNPPLGYRELDKGESIEANDLAFNSIKQKFIMERKLKSPAIGQKYYPMGVHFKTFRKITEKKEQKSKWEFYGFSNNSEPKLIIASEQGGYIFYSNGASLFGKKISEKYTIKDAINYGCIRIDKQKALSLIIPGARSKVFNNDFIYF